MKKVTLFIALLVSLSLTASLFAAESKVQQDVDLVFQSTPVVEPAPEAELVFHSSEPTPPLELAVLSEQEMAETEGAWGWKGALISVVVQLIKKPDSNIQEVATSAAIGAVNPFGYDGPLGWNTWL